MRRSPASPATQCLRAGHPHCERQRGWSQCSAVFSGAKATASRERKACGSGFEYLDAMTAKWKILEHPPHSPPLDPAEDMGKDQPLVLIHLNSARIRQNIFRPLCDQRCSWGSEWILKKSPTFLMVCPYWFRLRRVREGRMSTRELLASHSYSTINAGSAGICKAVASALVLLAIPMIAITSAYCSSVSPLARAAAVWECTQ